MGGVGDILRFFEECRYLLAVLVVAGSRCRGQEGGSPFGVLAEEGVEGVRGNAEYLGRALYGVVSQEVVESFGGDRHQIDATRDGAVPGETGTGVDADIDRIGVDFEDGRYFVDRDFLLEEREELFVGESVFRCKARQGHAGGKEFGVDPEASPESGGFYSEVFRGPVDVPELREEGGYLVMVVG